jgi:hypothetical protein
MTEQLCLVSHTKVATHQLQEHNETTWSERTANNSSKVLFVADIFTHLTLTAFFHLQKQMLPE